MILPVLYNTLSTGQGLDTGLAKILDEVVDGTVTLRQAIAILLSVAAGKTSISEGVVTFRDVSDTKDRVTATMTGSERTGISLDGT